MAMRMTAYSTRTVLPGRLRVGEVGGSTGG